MCAICGVNNFKTTAEYHSHYRVVHSVRANPNSVPVELTLKKKVIKPFNVSGRTKQQIVADMENTVLRGCIIG